MRIRGRGKQSNVFILLVPSIRVKLEINSVYSVFFIYFKKYIRSGVKRKNYARIPRNEHDGLVLQNYNNII